MEVLSRDGMAVMDTMICRSQHRSTDCVVRMAYERVPKKMFYGGLDPGTRACRGLTKGYNDTLKSSIKKCDIDLDNWEHIAAYRSDSDGQVFIRTANSLESGNEEVAGRYSAIH